MVILVALFACQQDTPKPVPPPAPVPRLLDGDIACGPHTCHTNQVCVTEQAGHTCWTGSGVGEYGIHAQYCIDVPAACNGVPSCKCIECGGMCGVQGRNMGCGCY